MKKLVGAWLLAVSCWQGGTAFGAPQVGWWWNPNESGRGFFVESQNGVTFVGAYFYDEDGHATWLVAGGPNQDSYNYTGPLYAVSNGPTLFGTYVAPSPPVNVGNVSIHFTDDTHGTWTWPGGTVAIERQIFGGTDAPFQPFSGWWWNPDESGSGYSVELQGDKLFIVGFMYDDSGRPVWYLSAGPMSSPTTYHGDVLQFANGQTMAGPYHPPSSYTTVATLDVEFAALDAATFTFTEAPGARTLARKAGRSSTRIVRPQLPKEPIYIPPKGFTGVLTIDTKTHVADVFVDDLHFVHRFAVTLLESQELIGAYLHIEGELELTYDDVSVSSDAFCSAHGERLDNLAAAGSDGSGLFFTIDASPTQHYHLEVFLLPDKFSVDVSGSCTDNDGTVTLLKTQAAPGTGNLDHEGAIVGDTIKGGGIRTIVSEGITSTVTYDWSFTAIR